MKNANDQTEKWLTHISKFIKRPKDSFFMILHQIT